MTEIRLQGEDYLALILLIGVPILILALTLWDWAARRTMRLLGTCGPRPPSQEGSGIWRTTQGQVLEVLEVKKGWVYVRVDGKYRLKVRIDQWPILVHRQGARPQRSMKGKKDA